MTLGELLQRFENPKRTSNGYQVCCPAHEDDKASLSLSEGDDGRILLHCKASCRPRDVVVAMGLEWSDMFPPGTRKRNGHAPIVASYDYHNAGGDVVMRVDRDANKSFWQKRPDGRSGWRYGLKDNPKKHYPFPVPPLKQTPIYHLPQVLGAPADAIVFITEGEKDADNLATLGAIATCNPMGAGKWRAHHAKWLKGRRVAILPDNDAPGRDHARAVARSLEGVATEVRIVELPDLPEKSDVSDWLSAGGTLPQLLELVAGSPLCSPDGAYESGASDDDGKPTPAELGRAFLADHRAIALHGQLYVYRGGVYGEKGGELDVRRFAQTTLGDRARRRDGDELIYWLTTELDVDDHADPPDLINVANGLLEWETGKLRPHDPAVLSTVQLPTAWDPEARHQRFDQFLDEVLPDYKTRAVVEEFVGYCFLPDCRYQKTLMLTDERGDNGKSVLLEAWVAMLGRDNVSAVSLQDLNHRFRSAALVGKLANICADLPREALRDSGAFKMLVTGDPLQVERKHKPPFILRNRAKFAFSANELPGTRDRSPAFFRRWIIVPFPAHFPKGDPRRDPDLPAKLAVPEACSYLLRIGVEGLRRLVSRGRFEDTPATTRALEEYRRDADNVAAFWDARCSFDAAALEVKDNAYQAYRSWCEANGHIPVTGNIFGKRLKSIEPRLEDTKTTTAARRRNAWRGLKLAPGYEADREPAPDELWGNR